MSDSYRRLFVPPLAGLEGQGRGSLGGGSSARVPYSLCQGSSTVSGTHLHAFLRPHVHQGVALEEVTRALISKGAVELAPLPSLGFYSRLFVVWKTSGSWRPVIDLSHLNRFLASSPFKMGTIQSVLFSIRPGDWMVSIDLKEAYLQIPVHLDSRKYLRFVAFGCVYQFRALCPPPPPPPPLSSHVLWLLFRQSCIPSVFVFVTI